ncbi:hypothetical protein [Candidatus Poriferisocius sp.]|uniref:hypothetical protein n=1 Tax=Candidatus Poriferisocius sp. TaxID=3101276 RepID=UPI003B01530F
MSDRSNSTPDGNPPNGNPPNKVMAELKTLVSGYARQEIVVPLSQLGKTLKLGILGALSIGIGLIFLVIAGLRLLQTEASGVFDGNMGVLPYLVVLAGVVLVLAAAIAIKTRTSGGDRS